MPVLLLNFSKKLSDNQTAQIYKALQVEGFITRIVEERIVSLLLKNTDDYAAQVKKADFLGKGVYDGVVIVLPSDPLLAALLSLYIEKKKGPFYIARFSEDCLRELIDTFDIKWN